MESLSQAKKLGFSKKMGWVVIIPFLYGLFYTISLYLLEHYQSLYSFVSVFTQDATGWFNNRLQSIQDYTGLLRASVLWGGVVVLVFFLLSRIKRLREGWSFLLSLRYAVLVVILFLSLLSDLKPYLRWKDNLTYDLFEISSDLNGLPRGSILAGPWAASLSLENHHRAIFMQNFANKDKVLERFKPTHLLIYKNGLEDKYFQETYPGIMAKAKLLKEYNIHENPMLLYELPRE